MEGNESDLGWRAPVPLSATTKKLHDECLQPYLCMLLVSCRVLRLPMETIFTAACLLHRYVLLVEELPPEEEFRWTVMCVIFIACKQTERHRRLRDFINLSHMLAHKPKEEDNQAKSSEQKASLSALSWNPTPPDLDDDYWKSKEYIVKAEQSVLRKLGFDVHVSLPHRLVVLIVEDCFHDISLETQHKWVKETWKLLNTCVFSVAALQQPTLPLAVAALDITIAHNSSSDEGLVESSTDWWEGTGVPLCDKNRATLVLRAVQST